MIEDININVHKWMHVQVYPTIHPSTRPSIHAHMICIDAPVLDMLEHMDKDARIFMYSTYTRPAMVRTYIRICVNTHNKYTICILYIYTLYYILLYIYYYIVYNIIFYILYILYTYIILYIIFYIDIINIYIHIHIYTRIDDIL